MKLNNKVALITGAAGGIGEATARRFVAEGASVVLVDREQSSVHELAQSLGDKAAAIVADASSPDDVARAVEQTIVRFGGLDIYFANAGIEGMVRPLVDYPVEKFDRVLSVNLRGAFLGIKYGAPAIAKRGGGAILVTSSVAGIVGSSGLGPYCATKHGVIGLVKTAAIELAPLKVRVVAINPGPIENRMMRSIEAQAAPGAPEAVKSGFEKMIPMGRYGTNDEIASLAAFLASSEASYCTGATFLADGGFVAG